MQQAGARGALSSSHLSLSQEVKTGMQLTQRPLRRERTSSVYFLDLPSVLEHLHGMNALVWTTLPHGLPSHPSPAVGYIHLHEGTIDACWIDGINGFRIQGPLAMQYVEHREAWTVDLEQGDEVPLQQVSSPAPQTRSDGKYPSPQAVPDSRSFDELVFSQRCPLPSHLLDNLSHKERMRVRMVHLMMDGRRSIEHIRQTLHLSSSTIQEAVTTLQHLHVIAETTQT